MEKKTKAIIDPNKPNLDFDGDDPIPVNLLSLAAPRNQQMISRLQRFVQVSELTRIPDGFDITAPPFNEGEVLVGTCISYKENIILHITRKEANKDLGDGSLLIAYRCTPRGNFLSRESPPNAAFLNWASARGLIVVPDDYT